MVLFRYIILAFTTINLATASVVPRAPVPASTLISDIMGIDDGVKAFIATLNSYNDGTLVAVPFAADTTAIHLANRKGFVDANLANPYNTADANSIIDYTVKSVGKDIPESVTLLVNKRPMLVDAGLQIPIQASLQLLLNDHDTFSAALLQKFPPDASPEGPAVVAKIHNAIQSGIDAFST